MTKAIKFYFPPVKGGMNITIGTRMRQSVLKELVQITGGLLSSGGTSIFRCDEDAEDRVREVMAREYPAWEIQVRDDRAKVQREGEKVKWANVKNSWYTERLGYVGTFRMFKVSTSTSRGDDRPYILSCVIPEMITGQNQYATEDEAEMAAEDVLGRFFSLLGAALVD